MTVWEGKRSPKCSKEVQWNCSGTAMGVASHPEKRKWPFGKESLARGSPSQTSVASHRPSDPSKERADQPVQSSASQADHSTIPASQPADRHIRPASKPEAEGQPS